MIHISVGDKSTYLYGFLVVVEKEKNTLNTVLQTDIQL